jgi:hypothetical protein
MSNVSYSVYQVSSLVLDRHGSVAGVTTADAPSENNRSVDYMSLRQSRHAPDLSAPPMPSTAASFAMAAAK